MFQRMYLKIAGVPKELISQAIPVFKQAGKDCTFLNLKKWYTRLFLAKKLAAKLSWENNRLVEVDPKYLEHDIAPMINITVHGDNGPWVETPEGGRPIENWALNTDPESEEYKQSVKDNYWCKGEHQRSPKSMEVQLRRNGGEGRAYMLGKAVDLTPGNELKIWRGKKSLIEVVAYQSGEAWLIRAYWNFGLFKLLSRFGYEVDNFFCGDYALRMWYPVQGYESKAPLTWSTLPTRSKVPPRKPFEGVEQTPE